MYLKSDPLGYTKTISTNVYICTYYTYDAGHDFYIGRPCLWIGFLRGVEFVLLAVCAGLTSPRSTCALIASGYCFPIVTSGTIAALATGSLMQRVGHQLLMTAGLVAFAVRTILIATCPVGQVFWKGPDTLLRQSDAFESRGPQISGDCCWHDQSRGELQHCARSGHSKVGGTIESHTNRGGETAEDKLAGYRAALYSSALASAWQDLGLWCLSHIQSRSG